ncbi:hypothetical protein Tco_0149248 [Tanacetum coccineum]
MPATEKSSKPAPTSKPKVTKEKPSNPSTAKLPKPKPAKEKSTKATPLQKAGKGKVVKVRNVKSSFQLVDEPDEEPAQPEPEPEPEHQSEGEEYDVDRAIQMSLELFHAEVHTHVGGVAIREPVTEATRPLPVVEVKGKAIITEEQAAQSLIDTPANIVCDTPSPVDAETGAESDKTNSGGDTEILYISEERGEDMDNQVNLEERLLTSQARLGSTKSTRTLSLIKNLEDAYTIGDQFFNDKSTKDNWENSIEAEVVYMVTVLIYQASSSVPPLSTPIIDLSPPKPAPSTTQVPIFTTTTTTTTTTCLLLPPPQQQSITDSELVARVTALEQKFTAFEHKCKTLDSMTQNLRSRVFTLDLRDLPHKIDETVRETVKEVVQVALHAPLRDRFRDLPEADMKEMLHQRMFESGSYKLLPKNFALYEALEASIERAQRDEFFVERDKSRKKQRDDQDPPPPLPNSNLSKKKPHNSGTSGSSQPPTP